MRPEILIATIQFVLLAICTVTLLVRFGTSRLSGVLLAYLLLTGLSLLTPHMLPSVSDWLRHTPYYLAQLVFMYFLHILVERSDSLKRSTADCETPGSQQEHKQAPALLGTMSLGSFLTHEGLHHLLALPFLLGIVTQVSLNYGYVTARWLRAVLNLGVAASLAFCLTHLAEFVLESQNVSTLTIQSHVENIEFGFNLIGLLLILALILRIDRVVADQRRKA